MRLSEFVAPTLKSPTWRWDGERLDILRGLWAEGLSASKCAEALGEQFGVAPSRNAVIGKARHLELPKRETAIKAPRKPSAAPPMAPRLTQLQIVKRPAPALTASPVIEQPEPSSLSVPLLALEPCHCRWPTHRENDEWLFCGARRMRNKIYCEAHVARASGGTPQARNLKAEARA